MAFSSKNLMCSCMWRPLDRSLREFSRSSIWIPRAVASRPPPLPTSKNSMTSTPSLRKFQMLPMIHSAWTFMSLISDTMIFYSKTLYFPNHLLMLTSLPIAPDSLAMPKICPLPINFEHRKIINIFFMMDFFLNLKAGKLGFTTK